MRSRLVFLLAACVLACQLSACGGGSSPSGSAAQAQVAGVATPKSVSVVTAN
jgi:hypothetical protein